MYTKETTKLPQKSCSTHTKKRNRQPCDRIYNGFDGWWFVIQKLLCYTNFTLIIVAWALCFILGTSGNELNKNPSVIPTLGTAEEEMAANTEHRYPSSKCFQKRKFTRTPASWWHNYANIIIITKESPYPTCFFAKGNWAERENFIFINKIFRITFAKKLQLPCSFRLCIIPLSLCCFLGCFVISFF